MTLVTERRVFAPYGLHGGTEGRRGENVLVRRDREEVLPGKVTLRVEAGDILSVRTPGGGGIGRLPAPDEPC